jgi:hypothetical protein
MPDPIILGRITIYAREVVLGDDEKAFSVIMYSTSEFKCRVPFNQTPKTEGNIFVRPEESTSPFPPVGGSDPNGECGVQAPFLKYEFKEGSVVWVAVDEKGALIKGMRGRLSEMFRIPLG